MTTSNRSIVVSVFQDYDQAQQAINDLLNAGFSNDQIKYSTGQNGSITDDLMGLGMPQQDAGFYNSEFEAGRTIVTVNTADRQQEAYAILSRDGGYDARSRGMSAQTPTAAPAGPAGEAQNLKLREEQLQVGKERVQAGEVGIHKDVVTEQKNIQVPVTHEEVVIERRPGSGQPTDTPVGEGDAIRVPISEEKVNVSKQTVESGEVQVGKRRVQETQQVSDTVKREEARLDREGNVEVENSDDVNAPGQP